MGFPLVVGRMVGKPDTAVGLILTRLILIYFNLFFLYINIHSTNRALFILLVRRSAVRRSFAVDAFARFALLPKTGKWPIYPWQWTGLAGH